MPDALEKEPWLSVFWIKAVNGDGDAPFKGYTKHSFFELQYVLSGETDMLVNGRALALRDGEFTVVPPDTLHSVERVDGTRLIIGFDPGGKSGLFESGARRRETEFLRKTANLMLSGTRASDERAELSLIRTLFFELAAIESAGNGPPPDVGSGANPGGRTASDILRYIRDRRGVGITVRGLARHFAISERQLGRIFTKEAGITPREAINREKLRRVEELAVSGPLSFSEIAELCGFCDEYALNKFFRRYNRVNISEYRRAVTPNAATREKP